MLNFCPILTGKIAGLSALFLKTYSQIQRKKQYSPTKSCREEKLILGLKRVETDQDRGRVKVKKLERDS